MRPGQAGGRAAHQGAEVVAQGPVVVDLPLQMMSRKSSPSRMYPRLLRMLLKGAGRATRAHCLDLRPRAPSLPERWAFREPRPLAPGSPRDGKGVARPDSHLRLPRRVGTEEVVVTDVLVPCDIHHLQWSGDRVG